MTDQSLKKDFDADFDTPKNPFGIFGVSVWGIYFALLLLGVFLWLPL